LLPASRCLFSLFLDSIPGSRRLLHFISAVFHFGIANCGCRVSGSYSETKPSAWLTVLLLPLPRLARLTAIQALCALNYYSLSACLITIQIPCALYCNCIAMQTPLRALLLFGLCAHLNAPQPPKPRLVSALIRGSIPPRHAAQFPI
jgi:hypothetical protein